MKHSDDCPRPNSNFPCCEDQMCPCDRDAFEELKSKLAKAKEDLEFCADSNSCKKSSVDHASKIHNDDLKHIVEMFLHRR